MGTAVTKKWLRMAAIYKRFAKDFPQADFSKDAALELFNKESFGTPMPACQQVNGFAVGKKWMDATIAMWREDIAKGNLSVLELLADNYPVWFLQRINLIEGVKNKS